VILGFVLATRHNEVLYDYNYYAKSYSPALYKFHQPDNIKYTKGISNKFFQIASPYLGYNLNNILQKINSENFYESLQNSNRAFLADTTVPDTTKKKTDSINVKTTDTLSVIDSTGKKTTILRSNITSNPVFDTTEKMPSNAVDSLNISVFDSLMTIDSLRLIDSNAIKGVKTLRLYDSTSRVNNFKYKPVDNPFTPPFNEPQYILFGAKKSVVTYETKIDTFKNMVIISEKVDGKNVKIPIWMSLEDYIFLSRIYFTRRNWDDLAHRYELKLTNEKIEIGSLLSSITNIDIPIPENPLMSIFGDRSRINLRITGSVNIRGAFRSSTTEGVTSSRLGNTRNEPDFKQTVSIHGRR
jgi:hypothetical protein